MQLKFGLEFMVGFQKHLQIKLHKLNLKLYVKGGYYLKQILSRFTITSVLKLYNVS